MSDLIELRFQEPLDKPESCIQTFPCTHTCTLAFADGISKTKDLNGVSIVEYLQQLGKPIPPHFREYIDFEF